MLLLRSEDFYVYQRQNIKTQVAPTKSKVIYSMFSGNHISNLRKILVPFKAHKKTLLSATILICLTTVLEVLGLSVALPFLLLIFELEVAVAPFHGFWPMTAISNLSDWTILLILMLVFTLRSVVMHAAVGLITRATTTVSHRMRTDFINRLFGSHIDVIKLMSHGKYPITCAPLMDRNA